MNVLINKPEIAKQVRFVAESIRKSCEEDHISGSCMYCTAVGYILLRRAGFRVIPQAGSLDYPIINSLKDDGKSPTHFSFMFSPDQPLPENSMPEIHAWLFDLDSLEIIDFSTYGLKKQCEAMGIKWPGSDPLTFVWDRPQFLEANRIYYTPDGRAIHYMLGVIREIIEQNNLRVIAS